VKYSTTTRPLCLGMSNIGRLSTRLPLGSRQTGYELELYVEIRDNEDGLTIYKIANRVVVVPDNMNDFLMRQLDELFYVDDNDVQWRPTIVFEQLFRPTLMQQGVQILSSVLSIINQDQPRSVPNEKKIRSTFVDALNKAALVDMTDVETISSVLALAVFKEEHLNEPTAVAALKYSFHFFNSFSLIFNSFHFFNKATAIECATKLIETMMNNSRAYEHNQRLMTTLVEILGRSLNAFNLRGGGVVEEQEPNDSMKSEQMRRVGTIQALDGLNAIGSYLSSHLAQNQEYEIRTSRIEMHLVKRQASMLNRTIRANSGGRFLLNYPFCQLVANRREHCEIQLVTQQVKKRTLTN
jgi:hypothetical protein